VLAPLPPTRSFGFGSNCYFVLGAGRLAAGRGPISGGEATPAEHIVDPGSFRPALDQLTTGNPLDYPGYTASLERARAHSGVDESLLAGRATIVGHDVELAAFQFRFLGGSMGEVAGERLARGFERAAKRGVPFVLCTATGGARMQEGMRALVQMPKAVIARLELATAHQPFIAVLGSPTTGGVYASAGALADLTVAEQGATVGFAGPRLVQRFTGRSLGRESHTAERALSAGLVDAVIPRAALRAYVRRALEVLRPDDGTETPAPSGSGAQRAPADAWEVVQAVRRPGRLSGRDLVEALGGAVVTLCGDRAGSEDPGLVAALTRIDGRRALVLALDRERPPGPPAYRKARRCVAVAERLQIPVVTLVDTPGADPSERSEAGGVARAIAELLESMLTVATPTLCVVTGEGGSGGALAFAAADALFAFSDATFSVTAPEAAAEIMWRDAGRAPEAARMLRLTAPDLLALGVADALIDRPLSEAALRETVAYHLARIQASGASPEQRRARRLERWRGSG
jgi:acetyl-CoA carboxylase beta subunit/acetyl-CoA carboxylase alpha subunit